MKKITLFLTALLVTMSVFAQVAVTPLLEATSAKNALPEWAGVSSYDGRSMAVLGDKLYISLAADSKLAVVDLTNPDLSSAVADAQIISLSQPLGSLVVTQDAKLLALLGEGSSSLNVVEVNPANGTTSSFITITPNGEKGALNYFSYYGKTTNFSSYLVAASSVKGGHGGQNAYIWQLGNTQNVKNTTVVSLSTPAGAASMPLFYPAASNRFFQMSASNGPDYWNTSNGNVMTPFNDGVLSAQTYPASGMAVAKFNNKDVMFRTLGAFGGFEMLNFKFNSMGATTSNELKQSALHVADPSAASNDALVTPIAVRTVSDTELQVFQFVPGHGLTAYKVAFAAADKPVVVNSVDELKQNANKEVIFTTQLRRVVESDMPYFYIDSPDNISVSYNGVIPAAATFHGVYDGSVFNVSSVDNQTAFFSVDDYEAYLKASNLYIADKAYGINTPFTVSMVIKGEGTAGELFVTYMVKSGIAQKPFGILLRCANVSDIKVGDVFNSVSGVLNLAKNGKGRFVAVDHPVVSASGAEVPYLSSSEYESFAEISRLQNIFEALPLDLGEATLAGSAQSGFTLSDGATELPVVGVGGLDLSLYVGKCNVKAVFDNFNSQIVNVAAPTLLVAPNNIYKTFSGDLYLGLNSNWATANPRFAAYFISPYGDPVWVDMSKVPFENVYKVVVPEGVYDKVIFCRMNPDVAGNDWANRWNQTSDLLAIDAADNNLYIVADNTWDKGAGSWSKYDAPNHVVSLVGDLPCFDGDPWNVSSVADELTSAGAGLYTKVYDAVSLEANTYKYKVARDHKWDVSYGDPNNSSDDNNVYLEINEPGLYVLTFTVKDLYNGVVVSCDASIVPEAPIFNLSDGVVTISSATEGAVIYYSILKDAEPDVPAIVPENIYDTQVPAFDISVNCKYYVKAVAVLNGISSAVSSQVYEIKGGSVGVDVENNQISTSSVFANNSTIFVEAAEGSMVEVYTIQGQRVYAAEAVSETTVIEGINANIAIVRVNGECFKVILK